MSEVSDRLRAARQAAGFETAADAARAFGWKEPTYFGHENGSRGLTTETAQRYARYFRVSVEWLLSGTGDSTRKLVPLKGHVGAGAKIYALPDDGALEEIDPPPGVGPDAVAVKVIGDSMMPRYLEGDILVFEKHASLREADGEECVVETSEGSTYVKTVHLEKDGLVTLESWNAPLMRNVEPVWVAPIVWVKRGRRPRPSPRK